MHNYKISFPGVARFKLDLIKNNFHTSHGLYPLSGNKMDAGRNKVKIYSPPPDISLSSTSYPLGSLMYMDLDFSNSTGPP